MIQFFRQLRKGLLQQGKLTNYLFYAIGEIFLVVVGILIALAINKNQAFNDQRTQELEILENIQEDLARDRLELQAHIDTTQIYIEEAEMLLKSLSTTNENGMEDFVRYAGVFGKRESFTITDGAYIESVSSSRLSFILSKELRNAIIAYYKEGQTRMDRIAHDMMINFVMPYFWESVSNTKDFALSQGLDKVDLPNFSLDEIKESRDFKGAVVRLVSLYVSQIADWNKKIAANRELDQIISTTLTKLRQ